MLNSKSSVIIPFTLAILLGTLPAGWCRLVTFHVPCSTSNAAADKQVSEVGSDADCEYLPSRPGSKSSHDGLIESWTFRYEFCSSAGRNMEDREKMMLQGCHWHAEVDYGHRVPARLENSENGSAEIFPMILGKANIFG